MTISGARHAALHLVNARRKHCGGVCPSPMYSRSFKAWPVTKKAVNRYGAHFMASSFANKMSVRVTSSRRKLTPPPNIIRAPENLRHELTIACLRGII